MPAQSFADMRRRNALSIVTLLREKGELSRVELSRLTNLSPATVSSIVEDLLQANLVNQTSSRMAGRGRPSVGVRFNASASFFAGISFGDDDVRIAICNLDGELAGDAAIAYCNCQTETQLIEEIHQALGKLVKGAGAGLSKLKVIGVAVPGPLHGVEQQIIHLNNQRSVELPQVYAQIRTTLKKPLHFDSNTNMAALFETSKGSAREMKSVLVVRVGHQVRSALVVDGTLFQGHQNLAGEIGHLIVPGNNRPCSCGQIGCVNAQASTASVIASCAQAGVRAQSLHEVIEGARAGRAACIDAIVDAGHATGYAVAVFLNTLAPALTVITGQLVDAGSLFATPLQQSLVQFSLSPNLSTCKVEVISPSANPEASGAALKALSAYSVSALIAH